MRLKEGERSLTPWRSGDWFGRAFNWQMFHLERFWWRVRDLSSFVAGERHQGNDSDAWFLLTVIWNANWYSWIFGGSIWWLLVWSWLSLLCARLVRASSRSRANG